MLTGPVGEQSDARLIELIRDGDERAFEALTRRYWRQLLIYADRLLGPDVRAEDACQQALLQAWQALRSGAEVGEVRAWLYRIVHNRAVTILRRARHDTVELNEALDASASDAGQEARVVLAEILERLSAMPEPQRDALVMTAVCGHSHAETAAALGLSDGAVRGLIYRARVALRGAAAGVLPVGLSNWFARFGARRSSLSGDEAAAGVAGSAGIAAVAVKGGAVLAAVAALTGAGQLTHSIPTRAGQHPRVATQRGSGRPAGVASALTPAHSADALVYRLTGSTGTRHRSGGSPGSENRASGDGARGGHARSGRDSGQGSGSDSGQGSGSGSHSGGSGPGSDSDTGSGPGPGSGRGPQATGDPGPSNSGSRPVGSSGSGSSDADQASSAGPNATVASDSGSNGASGSGSGSAAHGGSASGSGGGSDSAPGAGSGSGSALVGGSTPVGGSGSDGGSDSGSGSNGGSGDSGLQQRGS